MKIRIGTRKSELAVAQAEIVRKEIEKRCPGASTELVLITTRGDELLERPLASFGGKGVFIRELEAALAEGRIDLAVHSAKDMPAECARGLVQGAVLGRCDARDVVVTADGTPLSRLSPGAVVGTGSLRREIQVRQINPDIEVRPVRGNVRSRLRKLKAGEYDALILAAAGLKRLGIGTGEGQGQEEMAPIWDEKEKLYIEYMDPGHFIPAAGQGIIATEIRQGELSDIMAAIHSREDAVCLAAERKFLEVLGGGCNAPCGAYCGQAGPGGQIRIIAMYAADGEHPVYRTASLGGEAGDEWEGKVRDSREVSNLYAHPMDDLLIKVAEKLAKEMILKKVSLVGAGPGNAGLLTLQGLQCVRKADVIIYDSLIAPSILNEARLDAELIYAGKRSLSHHLKQEEINSLLVEKAKEGKYVLRLKGGDPFVFGRGGEEALALKKAGIPFEIVSGVSSAYSVPAYAGIPVTDRNCASSFHVVTGHEDAHKKGSAVDYRALAAEEGTLVFLMGLKNLPEIVGQLLCFGKDAGTPAAVISRGTTARQRMVASSLGEICGRVKEEGLETPALIVVGNAASQEKGLPWFGDGPLAGKRILITGTRSMAGKLAAEILAMGGEPIALSLIETLPCEEGLWELLSLEAASRNSAGMRQGVALKQEVRQKWGQGLKQELKLGLSEKFREYTWAAFTSENGVEQFFSRLSESGIDIRALLHLKFAVIGSGSLRALQAHHIYADFIPSRFMSSVFAREWIPLLHEEDKVLLLRAKEGSRELPAALKERGIRYTDAAIYETRMDMRRKDELNRVIADVDYITIASGSAAKAFAAMADPEADLRGKVVSIGPATTKTCAKQGIPVAVEAEYYTAKGIVQAIRNAL